MTTFTDRIDNAVITPCMDKFDIFDSSNPLDHLSAEELCLSCPAFVECQGNQPPTVRARSNGTRSGFTGTWASRLYINGIAMPPVCTQCARYTFAYGQHGRCRCAHNRRTA